MFTVACCLVVGLGFGLGLGLGLGLDLVSGWLVVMHTYLCNFRLYLSRTEAKLCAGANKLRNRQNRTACRCIVGQVQH